MLNEMLGPRLAFIGLDETQRETLQELGRELQPLVAAAHKRLYDKIAETPSLRTHFRDAAHMTSARSLQDLHWKKLWSGRFDQDYLESVRRVGKVHARIGLEPRWYVGSYAIVMDQLIRDYLGSQKRAWLSRGDNGNADQLAVLLKAVLLDIELAVTVYFEEAQAERDRAAAETQQREVALNALLVSISQTSDAVLTGASEIVAASDDLAHRTEATAASLEETNASVLQMDQRLRATAEAAGQTVARADGAMRAVTAGRSVAEDAVSAMGRVSESAKGIDDVIEGLDKIAFQTRVLAMNAAVEAGRAGEAGRGFAVVADLVSALAMRAEEEAKRARDQLTVTQAEVMSAVEAVRQVDGALTGISENVSDVHQLLDTIANENAEQSSAIGEITSAIAAMDQTAQQNAAMVEQTSAAARNLMREITTLTEQANGSAKGERAPTSAPAPSMRLAYG